MIDTKYCMLNQRCQFIREEPDVDVLLMKVYAWGESQTHPYVWRITETSKTLCINKDIAKVMSYSKTTRNAISQPVVGIFKFRKEELYYVDTRTDLYYKIPLCTDVEFTNSIPDGIYPTAGVRSRANTITAPKTSEW